MTYALATLGPVDISGIKHTRTPSQRTVQELQEGTMPLVGVHQVDFTLKTYLPGHGTVKAETALSDIARLLGYVLGNSAGVASQTATGGTATVPTTSGANGGTAGAIVFCGVKGDGRADGQAGGDRIARGELAHAAHRPAGAMNNGDAIKFAEMMYPFENPANATSRRCASA
jgi:hypothetical protein